MSPFSPTPQGLEYLCVNAAEYLLADDMAMVVCPTPDNGIELVNQVACCGLLVGFDGRPHFGQECFDAFPGGFDEELALVLAHVLPQEVEALLNVGYPGFLWGQFQTPFTQELFQ
jgi:hypothetical protein